MIKTINLILLILAFLSVCTFYGFCVSYDNQVKKLNGDLQIFQNDLLSFNDSLSKDNRGKLPKNKKEDDSLQVQNRRIYNEVVAQIESLTNKSEKSVNIFFRAPKPFNNFRLYGYLALQLQNLHKNFEVFNDISEVEDDNSGKLYDVTLSKEGFIVIALYNIK